MSIDTFTAGVRPSPPDRGPARESIDGFLDFLRATLIRKSSGLTGADDAGHPDILRELLNRTAGA